MNSDTLVAVCAYTGDQHQVINALGQYMHHECPVVVFSPEDAPAEVIYPGVERRFVGRAAYIGAESFTRQVKHLEILLTYPQNYFLLNDSDSFCLSAQIPEHLFKYSQNTVWSNEVGEPRPHESPYPKIAMQPPYFLSRNVIEKMLSVAHKVPVHPITPYIDFQMVGLTCEAGLFHKSFTCLEHVPRIETPFEGSDSWQQLDYRIRYMGANFMHPIKTIPQLMLCREARTFYESRA